MPATLRIAALEDLTDDDRSRFGSKSVNLARLLRAGLPVPLGFAIAFDPGRRTHLSGDERALVLHAYADMVGDGADVPVAVRSSAVGEDGAEFSFAGQYSTALDVCGGDDVAAAVEGRLAGQSNERVSSYLAAAGRDPAGMGVLVQRMVPADFAGVCFTQSPEDASEVLVEVVEGLGEALVSGSRRPLRVALDPDSLEVAGVDDPDALFERVGAGAIRESARLSLEAEACFGHDVDVEWAKARGKVWLLQARPITTPEGEVVDDVRRTEIARLRQAADEVDEDVLVWTDFSLADMVPQPSSVTSGLFDMMGGPDGSVDGALRAVGLRYDRSQPSGALFETICGRAYLNLNALVSVADEALPIVLDARRIPETGDASIDPDAVPVRITWKRRREVAAMVAAVPRLVAVPVRFARLRARFDCEFGAATQPAALEEAARLRERDHSALTDAALGRAFDYYMRRFVELHTAHQISDYVSFVTRVLLRRSIETLYGPDSDTVERRLTTGLPGNFNTETNLDLARVAAGEMTMTEFLDRYGQRGNPDYEISAPRWREAPEPVEMMAAAIASADVDPVAQFADQRRARAEAEAAFSADIRKSRSLRLWHRPIMRELDYYQRYSPLRETTQGLCFHFIELARRVLLEVADRNALGDLVFAFSIAELRDVITHGPGDIARVRVRADSLRAARRVYLPHTIRSNDLDAIGRTPEMPSGALTGIAVSGGVARGRARVVASLDDASALQAGEILVTASADPSWTPLFLVAGGLVLEQGGMLSHPAIVAREYGLPAVVNVAQATRRVQTGQDLIVDGDHGRVVAES